MALTYIAQRYPVEAVVLRRKQSQTGERLKSSFLVLYSGSTLARAAADRSQLARKLADELARIGDNAVKLASDYKYPNRPAIESVSDFTSELRYLRATLAGLLEREFRGETFKSLQQAMASAQRLGKAPGLALVIDHPFGGAMPRIVWPSFADQRNGGLPLQAAFRAQRLEALPNSQANGLADCHEFFVRSTL